MSGSPPQVATRGRCLIRPATPADAQVAAILIHMTMGDLAEHLSGVPGAHQAKQLLSRLFVRLRNRFSYRFAEVAECGDEVVGLILGYSGRTMQQLQLPMAGQMLQVLGMPRFMHFLRKALPLRRLKEAEGAEYFVNTVAVLPEFQGRGIGSALLEHVERRARATGFRACSLSIAIGNLSACRLYERRGYRVVETNQLRPASAAAGPSSVHRMVKVL